MTTETTSIYIRIAEIQTKRRANWPTAMAPKDPALEQKHQDELSELRDKLEGKAPPQKHGFFKRLWSKFSSNADVEPPREMKANVQ